MIEYKTTMEYRQYRNSRNAHAFAAGINLLRPWLIKLAAVLAIIPWFGKAGAPPDQLSQAGFALNNEPSLKEIRYGKWGELTLVPTVISPPLELVSTEWGQMRRPAWFFPGMSADKAAGMLQAAGVRADDAARMSAKAQFEPRIDGVVFTPDSVWVRSLAPEIRARVYAILAKSELNSDQARSFMYRGANPEVWLGSSLISPQTRRIIEPLIYRNGEYMMFSDLQLVRAEIDSDEELRRLSKALFRMPTVIAYLSVDPAADLDVLADYWGRGGRQTKIRSLIEAVAEGGGDRFIDLVHFMPPFAQERLYCYPTFSGEDLNKPAIVNCIWTALNFFQSNPDDRFLNSEVALKTLKENYFLVESEFKFGDVVAFVNEEGNIFHAAVYIAYDIVFSKNGMSSMSPWTLMSIDEVKAYYRLQSENPRLIFHRRKDL